MVEKTEQDRLTEAARRSRRRYTTGDEDLDAKIADIVEGASFANDHDLLKEMIITCFRVARDRSDRGEMKLVNAALKEFAYAFKVFKQYRGIRKVSIFGSSRSLPPTPTTRRRRSSPQRWRSGDGW